MSLETFGLVWIRQNFGPYIDADGNYLEFETDKGVYVPTFVPGVGRAWNHKCTGYELRAKRGPKRRVIKEGKRFKMYLSEKEIDRLRERQPELFGGWKSVPDKNAGKVDSKWRTV